jgi:tRNA nucleotidyltransferase (CCA-adding enzyme)
VPVHPTLLSTLDEPTTARLFFAAALTPFRGVTYTDSKNKRHPAVEAVIRDGLKLGTQNHYLDGIPPLFAAAEMLANPSLNQERFRGPSEAIAIGQSNRGICVCSGPPMTSL